MPKKQPIQPVQDRQPGGDKKVSSSSAPSHCSSSLHQHTSSIPPDLMRELSSIRAEINLLRQENFALRQENKTLKSQIENRNIEEPNTNPPATKRRAVDDTSQVAAENSTPDQQLDTRITALEASVSSTWKLLHEQKNLQIELQQHHQTLQANMLTLQSSLQGSIDNLRAELHTSIREILSSVNNPSGRVPLIDTQYEPVLE